MSYADASINMTVHNGTKFCGAMILHKAPMSTLRFLVGQVAPPYEDPSLSLSTFSPHPCIVGPAITIITSEAPSIYGFTPLHEDAVKERNGSLNGFERRWAAYSVQCSSVTVPRSKGEPKEGEDGTLYVEQAVFYKCAVAAKEMNYVEYRRDTYGDDRPPSDFTGPLSARTWVGCFTSIRRLPYKRRGLNPIVS
ncbi:uncharacterized protein BT62DRAFT_995142 [Guyanagaster necrorhizus]|uniref:Uncharacterized protein n=1 Tax=Guyanagaster necrorhizus TaxID=856835 RepID=A0A9P7VQJ8_9AGAR|nr:uncharacterized protein BT62DRAFT_995142 [Guyanagaster necrorhizus MCA 3950]KAG7444615.1 hypothetical protein BT62DRAFT_995142 [Guyanagaster necrorhizus MCA 3950]